MYRTSAWTLSCSALFQNGSIGTLPNFMLYSKWLYFCISRHFFILSTECGPYCHQICDNTLPLLYTATSVAMKRKEGNKKRPGGSDTIVLSLDGKSGNDNQQRVPVQYLICFSDQLPCTLLSTFHISWLFPSYSFHSYHV